jgi:site-specific DNA-methyltransferase (adenine-specific)
MTDKPRVSIVHKDVWGASLDYPDNHFDGVLCDPPYHLTQNSRNGSPRKNDPATPFGRTKLCEKGFMGKTWDGGDVAMDPETWERLLRICKPGAHLLAFGGSRTHHRLMCAIEDGGWTIKDVLMYVFGSGFPKSRNLHGEFDGYGSALKPSYEPIILAMKPLDGTYQHNMDDWGCGALAIDACRVGCANEIIEQSGMKVDMSRSAIHSGYDRKNSTMFRTGKPKERGGPANAEGRWPATIIHDGSDEVLACFPQSKGQQGALNGHESSSKTSNCHGEFKDRSFFTPRGDSGSAARFFYTAKASKRERNAGLDAANGQTNIHPCLKPIALTEYLAKLILPPERSANNNDAHHLTSNHGPRRLIVPFCGSGSEVIGGINAGWEEITAIDCEAEYIPIAEARTEYWMKRHLDACGRRKVNGGMDGVEITEPVMTEAPHDR